MRVLRAKPFRGGVPWIVGGQENVLPPGLAQVVEAKTQCHHPFPLVG
jgi:hypothetical protein